jgi:putative ABC transport system permease protein
MSRYFHDIVIAIESIMANQMRSILTALGIIFGVAAVIAMLAIGKGAQQEILEQIKMVGVNNIIITPIVESSSLRSFPRDSPWRMWRPLKRCCLL